MNIKGYLTIFLSILTGMCFMTPAFALETGSILSKGADEMYLYLYIPDPGEGVEITCQIGTNSSESLEAQPIQAVEIPAKTCFLIDNSLSVAEQYRPKIKKILTELAANRMEGELYTIATFSDTFDILVEDSSDYLQIKNTLDTVSYQDQETYLTDVLYDLLESFKDQGSVFRRIVIVSDGVDNKAIGYTKEELYSLLKDSPCPIYTLGCSSQDNQEELKNMFALSRLTGGQSWLLDEVSDPMEIVNGVAESNDVLRISIKPKAEDCDGSRKGVFLKASMAGQTVEYRTEQQMPFAELTESVEEVNETEAEENSPSAAQTGSDTVRSKSGGRSKIVLAGVGVVVTGAFAAGLFLSRRKKESAFETAPPTSLIEPANGEVSHKTVFVGPDKQKEDSHITHLAWEQSIILEDQSDPRRSFTALFTDDRVIVGYNRECQIQLNYDESVSGRHCKIFKEDGSVKVQNLSQTNPTRLNGVQLRGNGVLKDGDILTLGRLNMKAKINL